MSQPETVEPEGERPAPVWTYALGGPAPEAAEPVEAQHPVLGPVAESDTMRRLREGMTRYRRI